MSTPLVWAYVLDTTGISDIYTVNGGILDYHPRLHEIVAVLPTNPDLGSDCNHKLFHSKTDIIYPLELQHMIECYNGGTPPVMDHIVNHGNDVVNHGLQVIN